MTVHGRLEGVLKLYPTEEGGREVPDGWISGLLRFGEDLTAGGSLLGCRVDMLGRAQLNPGEEADVAFWTIADLHFVEQHVRPGMRFRFWAGRDIGEGEIHSVGRYEL